MRRLDFPVGEEDAGKTVGVFLKYVHGVSSRTIKTLKHYPEGIQCNGQHTRTVDKIETGDVVTLVIKETPKGYQYSDAEVEILYEDQDVMVFNKPVNMSCHPTKKHQSDTLGNVFAAYCAKHGLTLSFRAINRLDRNTTGAVVVAKNAYSAYKIAQTVDKIYVGITLGTPSPTVGTIEEPILRVDELHILRTVSPEGQYAKTDYQVLSSEGNYSLLRFHLHTGRTHQIRVHMAHIGYPLAGDELYGGNQEQIHRNALHCAEVSFLHPTTQERVTVWAEPPEDMKRLLPIDKKIVCNKN